MTKQTAVEWVVDKLSLLDLDIHLHPEKYNVDEAIREKNKILQQAKAMEKEQIEDAYDDGVSEGEMRGESDDENEDRFDSYTSSTTYYNQTYGGDK
jgi:hypothetical protein